MLGVAAGLGLVGAAIRDFTKDARDNAAAQDEMIKKLAQLGPHGAAMGARLRIAELERQRDDPTFLERAGRLGTSARRLIPLACGASFVEQREAIEREIAAQRIIIANAMGQVGKPGAEAQRGANLQVREALSRNVLGADQGTDTAVTERIRRLRLEYEHIPPALAAVIAATERHAAELTLASTAARAAQEQTDEAAIRNRMLGASEDAVTEAIRRHKLELQGMASAVAAQVAGQERAAASTIKTANVLRTQLPQAFGAIAAAATQGFSNMAQTIVQQFAGIVANLPGVSPLGGGIIGVVGGLLGGLFGRGGSSRPQSVRVEEYGARAEDQLKRSRGTPDSQSIQIVLPDGTVLAQAQGLVEDVLYRLHRMEAVDAQPRFPRT